MKLMLSLALLGLASLTLAGCKSSQMQAINLSPPAARYYNEGR